MRSLTFRALFGAELVSTSGSAMTFVALPWFVLVTTGSATRMSFVLAAEILPMALLGIPSGTVVSRLGARRSMLVSDLVRAPLVALVPVLHWTGHLTFGLLLAVVFLLGVFMAPYAAAQRSIIPEVLGDDETEVAKASGLFGAANHLPLVIGPSIAGVLIAWIGTAPLLVVDGCTFLIAFLTVLTLVRAGKPVPADDESRGILAGVRYLARDPLLGPVTLTIIVLDGAANGISVAVPLLAYTRYDRNPHIAGWIFTAFGIGALAGSFLVMRLLDRYAPLKLACFGMVAATLPLWIVVAPVAWPVAGLAVVLCGLFVPLINAPLMGIITTRPPAALRAKVMTAVMAASGAGGPLGRLIVGPVYGWAGNAGVWIEVAGGMTVGGLLFIAAVLRSSAGDTPDVVPVPPVA
ncbi:MAG TPA: MFS transporter [Gaiellaceae bacterium]|jgi:MFS family permease|nr:MFS transporter [Gaiellaceae bacterium]